LPPRGGSEQPKFVEISDWLAWHATDKGSASQDNQGRKSPCHAKHYMCFVARMERSWQCAYEMKHYTWRYPERFEGFSLPPDIATIPLHLKALL
jgi:hypothetical protein